MVKQRHIGLAIFSACSLLSARIGVFEPKPDVATPAEERWGTVHREEGDPMHLIRGVRYYIYGLGVVGLLMVAEDFISQRARRNKESKAAHQPKAAPNSASGATDSRSTRPRGGRPDI